VDVAGPAGQLRRGLPLAILDIAQLSFDRGGALNNRVQLRADLLEL
jgi:hypothetical protein